MQKFSLTLAAIALAATVIGGCGSVTTAGLLRGPDEGSTAVQTQTHRATKAGGNWRGVPGVHEFGIPRSMFKKAAARLALTDAQKQQLRDIAKSHATSVKRADFAKYHQELEGLLQAEKVDQAALRAFITARAEEFAGRSAAHADIAAEMRQVLTDAQRKEVIAILSEDQPSAEIRKERRDMEGRARAGMDAFKAKLELTADQSAAFDALKAKLDAARNAERPALKKATIAFVESGDKAAFSGALRAAVMKHVPTDDLVRVAASLDKAQRDLIVARMDRFGRKMHRQHGRDHKR